MAKVSDVGTKTANKLEARAVALSSNSQTC